MRVGRGIYCYMRVRVRNLLLHAGEGEKFTVTCGWGEEFTVT